jgi:hypothetical protein
MEEKVAAGEAEMKTEYDFTLALTGISELNQKIEDALYEAGCDDATLSVRSGRVFVTFSRNADSLKDAILSAIHDVRKANIGAEVLRVDECNLVTQAEIARKSGRSRQMIHQYIKGIRGPGGFPPPVCDLCEGQPLWYWCEVAYWLWTNNLIKEVMYREAQELDVINTVLELNTSQRRTPGLTQEVVKSVGNPS